MAYRDSASAALQRAYREAKARPFPFDQIPNAKDALNPLPAASETPAAAVRASWYVFLSGQSIPLPWEPREENADGTFGAGI